MTADDTDDPIHKPFWFSLIEYGMLAMWTVQGLGLVCVLLRELGLMSF